MRILMLTSSHRKQGNTARMVQMIAERLQELSTGAGESLEIETRNLAHMHLEMCRGCRVCFDQGECKCPLKDDLLAVKSAMKAADGVIVASPVYVEDVNGVMKNWIDRLAHVCHRPEFAGKYAYILATSGVGSTDHALRTMNVALRTWGFHMIGQSRFTTGAYLPHQEMEARYRTQTRQIAHKVLESVRKNQATHPSFVSLMAFSMQQRYFRSADKDSIDHAYWATNGWANPRCDYYIPHKASRVKVALARLAGAVVPRFLS